MSELAARPGVRVNAAALQTDLAALGIDCSVEARDRLALIVPRDGHSSFAEPSLRREAVRLAQSHGFTHLALELADDELAAADDAPGENAAGEFAAGDDAHGENAAGEFAAGRLAAGDDAPGENAANDDAAL